MSVGGCGGETGIGGRGGFGMKGRAQGLGDWKFVLICRLDGSPLKIIITFPVLTSHSWWIHVCTGNTICILGRSGMTVHSPIQIWILDLQCFWLQINPIGVLTCSRFAFCAFAQRRGCRGSKISSLPPNPSQVPGLTLSLPRAINVKFPQQPNQRYYITQYEELGFS